MTRFSCCSFSERCAASVMQTTPAIAKLANCIPSTGSEPTSNKNSQGCQSVRKSVSSTIFHAEVPVRNEKFLSPVLLANSFQQVGMVNICRLTSDNIWFVISMISDQFLAVDYTSSFGFVREDKSQTGHGEGTGHGEVTAMGCFQGLFCHKTVSCYQSSEPTTRTANANDAAEALDTSACSLYI